MSSSTRASKFLLLAASRRTVASSSVQATFRTRPYLNHNLTCVRPPLILASRGFAHNTTQPPLPSPTPPSSSPNTDISSSSSSPTPSPTAPRPQQPSYELSFTCKPCSTRSAHRISKQGYHHGSVLITCPSCRNRHVISDHLNIFGDRKMTVEDLMREKGELVKKGTLGEDGDVEFWDDGSSTVREERFASGDPRAPGKKSA